MDGRLSGEKGDVGGEGCCLPLRRGGEQEEEEEEEEDGTRSADRPDSYPKIPFLKNWEGGKLGVGSDVVRCDEAGDGGRGRRGAERGGGVGVGATTTAALAATEEEEEEEEEEETLDELRGAYPICSGAMLLLNARSRFALACSREELGNVAAIREAWLDE